ncbi:MAG TPA: hypothetical protein VN026_11530 [Bacteroidia bacterium]|jgi:hypothetical protein|nr:hypothetical protein [Bacteroidia bacterium]
MEYAIQLLQSALNDELRALASANELTAGNGFRFNNETLKAFESSRELAKERIPQLQKAITLIHKK